VKHVKRYLGLQTNIDSIVLLNVKLVYATIVLRNFWSM